MKRRASRTAIWMSALALPAMLATGCSKDPENATATFSPQTEPTEVTMELGETKEASALTASYAMEGTHDAQVALRHVSTNRGVATLSLVQYVDGNFTGHPDGADYPADADEATKKQAIEAEAQATRPCPTRAKCFIPKTGGGDDKATLVITCNEDKPGVEEFEIQGEVFVTESFGRSHSIPDTTKLTVTCVEKVGSLPPGTGCDEGSAYASVGWLGEVLQGDSEAFCGALQTDLSQDPTVHSSDEVERGQGAGDHTELAARLATEITLSAPDLEAASEVLSCGQSAQGITLCGYGASAITTGSYLVFAGVMHGSIPLADDSTYQYAVVLDADGNAADNYQADPAYPHDFFQDSDRWLQASYSPGSGWLGTVTEATGGNPTEMMGSAARLILIDDLFVAVVPASELSQPQPSYRLTAIRHTGAWGFDGDWDGDVEPPVADGLASF